MISPSVSPSACALCGAPVGSPDVPAVETLDLGRVCPACASAFSVAERERVDVGELPRIFDVRRRR